MALHKESLNIFMGGSFSEASLDLFIDNPKGLLHSNNIDFRNSISKTQSIKFESEFSSSILDFENIHDPVKYNWSAKKVKILDDYAFVSYPEYTDINKVHITDTNGGLYRPFAAPRNVIINNNEGSDPDGPLDPDGPIPEEPGPPDPIDPGEPSSSGGFGGCPTNYSLYAPFENYVVLPDLSISEDIFKWGYEFENLFIVVEYDGWTTASNGDIVQTPLNEGRFEVFEFDYNLSKPSTWSYKWFVDNEQEIFDPLTNLKYPILLPKYLPLAASPELYNDPLISDPITSTRLLEAHVSSYDIQKLDHVIESLQLENPGNCYRMGFLGYAKIHYIKYTPIVKCGRVDMYERKHGVITSYNDSYISPSHKLKSGDIVEIVSSNGQDPSIACGTRYVQVRDSNSFFLYEDADFTSKIEDINIRFAVYNCVGNVYDNNDNGWRYRQSIFSPQGRNGECIPQQSWISSSEPPSSWEDHRPIPRLFSSCKTYKDIILKDVLNDFSLSSGESFRIVPDSYVNLENPNMQTRPPIISSGLDCLWAHHQGLVNSYRFGSDIDFIKNNNSYYLAIGERGVDQWINTEGTFFPYNQPHGKVHLFDIISNSLSFIETIYPWTYNTTPSIVTSTLQNIGFTSFCTAPYQTTQSSANNFYIPSSPHNFTDVSLSVSNLFEDDYWFGSMLMGRDGFLKYDSFYSYVRQYNYSSDVLDPTIDMLYYLSQFDPGFTSDGNRFYPYIDSFGKSVSLSMINGELVIAASSNTKTILEHPILRQKSVNDTPSTFLNYDYSYNYSTSFGGIDFGYIHLFSYSTETNNRIKIPVSSETFAKSFWAQKYACENFAKCMVFDGPTLHFGEPRSPDVTAESVPLITLNKSKIHTINVSQDVSLTPLVFKTVENSLNERMYYNASEATQSFAPGVTIDNKTRLIKSEFTDFELDNFVDFYDSERVYISDDFGANFIVSPKFIATNAYSLTNNRGIIVNTITDYVNVIDKNTNFTVARISPSIDKSLAVYDYDTTIGLDYPASLVEIGNNTYENSALSSVTWDTKLNNCYIIVDDTFILKDPIGYAFFDTNTWLCVESVVSPQRTNFITSDGSVRSTDTGRISYNNPIITYGSSSAKYHTDDFSTVDSWALLSFETSSFTDGTYAEFYSSDFGTSFDISRDDFLSLFIPVVDFQFSNFTGYTLGSLKDDEPIDLFMNANLSDSEFLNLFVGPIEINSPLNLSIPYITQRIADSDLSLSIINGNDLWSDQITTFLKTVDDFRALDLVLFPPLEFGGGLSMSIDPPFPLDKDLTLFTNGSLYFDSSLDIQLENYPDNQVRQALLLQISRDPININSFFDLSVFGTTIPGSSYLESGFSILMDSLQGSSGDLNLDLAVSNTGSVDDSLLLKIHNEMESGSSSESLVFSMEPFGANIFFTPSSGIRNLSIKGADILEDSLPLFIKKSGTFGEELIDSVNLFIHNTVVSSGVDIIMDCNLTSSEFMNLSFSQVVGLEDRNLNVFTRGFEE